VCRVRSLVKPLAFLYLATQLLLALPAGAAAPTGSHQTPCEQMAGASTQDHCPCCPDGVSSMKDCLASCTLAAVMSISTLSLVVAPSAAQAAPAPMFFIPRVNDPPLKPPPIA